MKPRDRKCIKIFFAAALSCAIIFSAAGLSACAEDPETVADERVAKLQETLDGLLRMHWDAEYSENELTVYVKPEYTYLTYTKNDFGDMKISEVTHLFDDMYIITLESSGINALMEAVVALYDLYFIAEVSLSYIEHGV